MAAQKRIWTADSGRTQTAQDNSTLQTQLGVGRCYLRHGLFSMGSASSQWFPIRLWAMLKGLQGL